MVFDLDDTLYKEIDYLRSAYRFIARRLGSVLLPEDNIYNIMIEAYTEGQDAFSVVRSALNIDTPIETLMQWYRTHIPDITLPDDSKNLLVYLHNKNIPIGILTDGRSLTQRNKIKALGLNRYVPEQNVLISEEFGSEKPSEKNYRYFETIYPGFVFIYVGDNPRKDFIAPNRLGWKTIGLIDDGRNIHKQETANNESNPRIWISELSADLIPLINTTLKRDETYKQQGLIKLPLKI